MEKLQNQLLTELDDLITHLQLYEVTSWTSKFKKVYELINNGDKRGLDFLTNIHGGMGSFSDLVICQLNDHKIDKTDEDFANKKLMTLGDIAISTADKLKRKLNKST